MDPATIIGTTSAILSFVQFSGKIISIAVQIHKSASGTSDDNQKFADVVAIFNDRLERLREDAGTFKSRASTTGDDRALNDAEKQLLATINRCEELARKIADVLTKTNAADRRDEKSTAKPSTGRALIRKLLSPTDAQKTSSNTSGKTGPTLSETIRAAVQTVWQKEAVEKLRKDWESCSVQLDQAIFRFENSNRLEIFYGVLQHHSADLVDIRDLLRTLVETSHNVEHLQSFLHDMREADSLSSQQKRNHEKILDALKFPGMHARRDRVAKAAGNTFAWLIEDECIPEKLTPGLKISLRQWLGTGTGVFHITGKPGSGKSTFMKFLDKSKEADLQLKKWAVGNHKELIRASCYLWKAAEVNCLQNELEGLTRTLLFQILQQRPDLTSTVFKSHPSWNPKDFTLVNCLTNSHSTAVTFESQEILTALESVLTISNHHFFLLIDGLDEMKNTREHEHKQIAERILQWSTQNSGNIKICVSSREDRAFVETFPCKQRLQLHDVTGEDIKTLVDLKLERHGYLASEEREALAATIGSQAGGVFLWVVLAIGTLMPLFNAKQGIQRLKQQVQTLPEEMNDFLAETLKRIPECYRKEAWAVFTVQALRDPHSRSRHILDDYGLIHYSMLQKCLDSTARRTNVHYRSMAAEDVAHQVQEFASRIFELSSGLLEIPDSLVYSLPLEASHNWAWRPPYVAHRSVYDFLRDHPDKLAKALAIPRDLQRLSGPELVIRSTIQLVIDVPWEELTKNEYVRYFGATPILHYLRRTTPLDVNLIFPLARIFEEVLLRKQGVLLDHQPFNKTQWTDLCLDHHTNTVFHKALTSGYRSYVAWAQEKGNYPSWITSTEFKVWTVERFFHDCCVENSITDCCPDWDMFHEDGIEFFHDLGWLFYDELIETDHSLIPGFSPVLRGPIWFHLLICRLVFSKDPIDGDVAKLCLNISKRGVYLDAQFEWWSDCYSPRQSSSGSHISAGDGDLLAEIRMPTSLGLKHEPEDKAHDESNEEPWSEPKHEPRSQVVDFSDIESDISETDTQSEFDAFRGRIEEWKSRGECPSASRFGMTVKWGGDEEPQLIQGPQWTGFQDNEMLPFFMESVNEAAGNTNIRNLLEIWLSEQIDNHFARQLFEKWASEVREGRKDLATAHKELKDEIYRMEKAAVTREEAWYPYQMREMSMQFPGLYKLTSMLEAPCSRAHPKNLSDDTRHNGEEDVQRPDQHERRAILGDSTVDVLKGKESILSNVCHDRSTITLLCLALLLAIFIGRVFH